MVYVKFSTCDYTRPESIYPPEYKDFDTRKDATSYLLSHGYVVEPVFDGIISGMSVFWSDKENCKATMFEW